MFFLNKVFLTLCALQSFFSRNCTCARGKDKKIRVTQTKIDPYPTLKKSSDPDLTLKNRIQFATVLNFLVQDILINFNDKFVFYVLIYKDIAVCNTYNIVTLASVYLCTDKKKEKEGERKRER